MYKRSFFKLTKPKFKYSLLKEEPLVTEIPLSDTAILLLEKENIRAGELQSYIGKRLKTGQIIKLNKADLISPVTGTVIKISQYTGYLNVGYYAVHIKTEEDEIVDPEEDYIPPSLPGIKNLRVLFSFDPPINHAVVMAVDTDLLITTNQLCFKNSFEYIKKGLNFITQRAKIGNITIVLFSDFASYAKELGYKYYILKERYPNSLPKLVVKKVLKSFIPEGKEPEDMGIAFLNAEAVANMGIFHDRKWSFDKFVTFINKDYSIKHIKARIGTPVSHILNQLGVQVEEGDRIIFGGPMRGKTIYSLETPIDYDTDAIFVQDKAEIIPSSDTHCINCGECVKVCPVNVPVNMLIRLLENGLFEEAAKEYGLLSCIECGLCSYVCIARIPVFHYIMLGKHELSKMGE